MRKNPISLAESRRPDYSYGGMYTAVDADGSPLSDFLPTTVWGFPAGQINGQAKSHIGQAVCIRYFITEYQRVSQSGVGVQELNRLLALDEAGAYRPNLAPALLKEPLDLLAQARNCADFVMNHLEIGSAQSSTTFPDRLFYWAYSNRDGSGGYLDDTAPTGQNSAVRSESILAWSLAELGLALQKAGQPETVWKPYQEGALRWWNWRQSRAAVLPAYGNPDQPQVNQGCNASITSNPNNCLAGVGRDIFLPALGFTLSELTGDSTYRQQATRFANEILGTGATPLFSPNPATGVPTNALQDQVYAAGYNRAIIFASHAQQNYGPLEERWQWWDFGNYPARLNPPTMAPWANPEMVDPNLSVPFAHFRGRELVAGTERSLWFFYTFGENPQIYYQGTFSQEKVNRQAVLDYWQFINEKFWDDGVGKAAWFEALNQPYKPCFSGGTDLPLADWLAPVIPGVSQQLEADNTARIISGLITDPDWSYLNWKFKGSGVAKVEVVYSTDQGRHWQSLEATPTAKTISSEVNPGSYSALIPTQPVGTTVYYYLRSQDYFGNHSAFPANTET